MQDFRERQKERHKLVLEKVRAYPEFQQLSKDEQKSVEGAMVQIMSDIDIQLDGIAEEAEQLLKIKTKEVLDFVLEAIRKAKELEKIVEVKKA